MENKADRVGVSRIQSMGLLLIIVAIGGLFMSTATASAGLMEDLPVALGEAIGAEDAEYAGGAILSFLVLMCVGITCGAAKLDVMPIAILLLAAMGVLVVVGWLDWWLLALSAIVIAILFARQITEGVGGKG